MCSNDSLLEELVSEMGQCSCDREVMKGFDESLSEIQNTDDAPRNKLKTRFGGAQPVFARLDDADIS